jgi:hypothetical protein
MPNKVDGIKDAKNAIDALEYLRRTLHARKIVTSTVSDSLSYNSRFSERSSRALT